MVLLRIVFHFMPSVSSRINALLALSALSKSIISMNSIVHELKGTNLDKWTAITDSLRNDVEMLKRKIKVKLSELKLLKFNLKKLHS